LPDLEPYTVYVNKLYGL